MRTSRYWKCHRHCPAIVATLTSPFWLLLPGTGPSAAMLHAQEVAQAQTENPVAAPAVSPPANTGVPEKLAAQGLVKDATTGAPIPGATVKVPDTSFRSITNAEGRYRLPPLPPGRYDVIVEAPGYDASLVRINLKTGARLPPIALRKADPNRSTNATIEVEVRRAVDDAPQVTERVLTLPELQKVPGSFNDAVRAVQNLPGIARSPFGFLVVRGTEPQDTGYYIDGIRVPQIFHFLGLHTVVNTDILEQVDFLPGNYGVRYGRTLGGVVDARTTEDIPAGRDGYVAMDLLNSVAFARTPIDNSSGIMLSVRRSYADLVLKKGLEIAEDIRGKPFDVGFIQAPSYWDYQVLYNRKLGEKQYLHALLFGSHDSVLAVTSPPAAVQPAFRANNTAGTTFSFDKGIVRHRYTGDYVQNLLTLSFGPDVNTFGFGGFAIAARNYGLFMREDFSVNWSPFGQLGLRAGMDGLFSGYQFDFTLPFDPKVQSLDPLATPEPYTRTMSGLFFSPALYLEGEYHPFKPLTVIGGFRYDPFWFPGFYTTQWFDPRLSVAYRPEENTTIKASAGRFGEQPLPFAVDPEYGGNPNIKPEYAWQYSLGVEHVFNDFLTAETTLFYSDQGNLVVIPTGDTERGGRPDFTNDGRGRSKGAEILLRHSPHNGLFGWISYTLMKAERLDGTPAPESKCKPGVAEVPEGACWYPFDFDQTHILTIVGSYELPHGWTIGGRFRYSTGVPYTRVGSAYYDVDRNYYVALPALDGARNDARIPAFNDLTLRVDKVTKFKHFKLNGYIEVINVYNRANPESVDYNFDYTEEIYVTGLPIFPNLGFKAEF